MSAALIEVTALASATGPLTKRISLSPDGELISDGSACVMSRGQARRVRLGSVTEFSTLIGGLRSDQAIALGSLRPGLPDQVEIATARRLAEGVGVSPGTVARTADHIGYAPHVPALVLLDFDTKAMPPAVAARLKALGGFWPALVTVAPDLERVARVTRRSTSSGIARGDTGELLPGSEGVHVFVLVRDGSDAERFLRALHDRCWLAGLGWMMVGAGGQFLERSIVDRMVFAAERLVFEGAPILHAPLVQDGVLRAPAATEGEAIDSLAACRFLSLVEQAKATQAKAADRQRISPAVAASRADFVKVQGKRIAVRTGIPPAAAERMAERQCGGVLLPGVVLAFDTDDMAGATVGDVLADPTGFVGATLADPLEGVPYGRCKAKIMQRADGSLWINSFAHGRIAYELKHDAASVERAIEAAEPAEAANVLVRMLPVADAEPDEEQRLRERAGELAGVKARPLGLKLKAARAQQARNRLADERERAEAANATGRLRLPAPLPDDERLPVIHAVDEALCGVAEDEPPMRDMDDHPVQIQTRPPMLMHELTSVGANQAETKHTTRLPAPEMPLLSQHSKFTMAHEIERYIKFETPGLANALPRPVALPQTFVDHFMEFRGSKLPRVGGIVTAPLVLADGRMLAEQGLDRARKLVFRIPRELLDLVKDVSKPSDDRVAKALHYLVNDWLCDVAASFTARCVLIALALTILERVLLSERPAFFVTAGKRGGGKTTTLAMIVLAVTGRKPPAAAWSSSEDERRKALAAYLAEGLAAMVFDNIPLGTMISCPTIEKILTAESYSDRILGQSAIVTVPAFTILCFTGNNVGPKGDLASRSLTARLDIEQPDLENRAFRHPDPIAYTIENRGKILRALFIILRANPQLHDPKPQKTRFKAWWHLVGSAVEHASACMAEQSGPTPIKGAVIAEAVDFSKVFREVEADDEEAASLGDALDALHDTWPMSCFAAGDVMRLVSTPR